MSAHDCATVYDDDCQACADHDATCGVRCDRCNERMCLWFGPEPRACGPTCADCPCSCTACLDARADRAADTLRHIEREKNLS